MKRVLLPSIIVSVFLLCAAVFSPATPQKPSDAPQSAEAVKARLKYEEELAKLNAEYAQKLKILRQQYVKDLDVVRKKALEKEDLDEAQRLLQEKRRLEAESLSSVPKGMWILCALWGTDTKWVDVTYDLRKAVTNSQLHFRLTEKNPLSSVPDVADGVRKTLVIAYTLDGKPYLSLTRDDEPVNLPPGK